MIAKLIAWGSSREEAIVRMERALREYRISGVRTNLAFHQALLQHPSFRKGNYDTGFVERSMAELKREVDEGYGEVARIAVEVHKSINKERGEGVRSEWKTIARREGLR